MESSSCYETPFILSVLVVFLLLFSPTFSSMDFKEENGTSMTGYETKKMKLINARLKKINKPFVKSIKSPDGDIIDCVLFHRQPSLNLSGLKEKMTLIPPKLPKGHDKRGNPEIKQLWNSKGESCPNGTIPIRRTSANDISISKARKKYSGKDIPVYPNHVHAIGYVNEGEFYGAKALLNVWEPNVTQYGFSLSQIWVLTNSPGIPANSVEAGWQFAIAGFPTKLPRYSSTTVYFLTPDGYKSGCYNTECPGFVHTSQKYCLGAAIDPISTYNGQQYDVAFTIWKDIKSGDWWLGVGTEPIGFWPKKLFTNLQDHATTIQYGGEVFSPDSGKHTSTQMGSGHFPDEGFGKAAYARNLQVVDQNNYLNAVSDLKLYPERPKCYAVKSNYNDLWGNYIYFGGPGDGPNCP